MPQDTAEFEKTPEAQYLKVIVNQLAARDYLSVESQIDSRVQQPNIHQVLEHLASMVPPGHPIKLNPVNWSFVKKVNVTKTEDVSRTAHVAIEYAYPESKWMVASASLSGEPGSFRITALNIEPIPVSLAELNAFTFRGKGIAHYVFLLLTVAAFGISVFAFVYCIRTPRIKRKWLWMIFILVGVIAFSLNWSNGAISVNIFSFKLLSASYSRIGWLGPWEVTFCIPVGALIFLWKYRRAIAVSTVES